MTRVQQIKHAEKMPKHSLSILSPRFGHREYRWDPDTGAGVAVAEREFNKARAAGSTAVNVGQDGQGSEVISTFDPNADAIVVTPQVIGG